jgi:anti-sigma factor RsiW
VECDEVSALLDAYIDDELDPGRAASLREHADGCSRCSALIEDRRSLRTVIASADRHTAPAFLHRDLASALAANAAPIRRARAPLWAWLSLAACVLMTGLVAVLASGRLRGSSIRDSVLPEAVSAHIRSLMAAHLADIVATDQHTVKPWFAGKLDFSPRVADFAGAGFALTGGRLDYLGGRPVAALIYTRRAHTINLFTCPDPSPDGGARWIEDRGYHAVGWSDGAMRFCAISDLSADELAVFVGLARGEDRSATGPRPPVHPTGRD